MATTSTTPSATSTAPSATNVPVESEPVNASALLVTTIPAVRMHVPFGSDATSFALPSALAGIVTFRVNLPSAAGGDGAEHGARRHDRDREHHTRGPAAAGDGDVAPRRRVGAVDGEVTDDRRVRVGGERGAARYGDEHQAGERECQESLSHRKFTVPLQHTR